MPFSSNHLSSFILLVCFCFAETVFGAPSARVNMTMVKDGHHKVEGFAKIKSAVKPGIFGKNKPSTPTEPIIVEVPKTAREQSCTTKPYGVELRFGSCKRTLQTQMCSGYCKGYTVPASHPSKGAELRNTCECCTVAGRSNLVSLVYTMKCRIDGIIKTKTFFVPKALECQCRVCTA